MTVSFGMNSLWTLFMCLVLLGIRDSGSLLIRFMTIQQAIFSDIDHVYIELQLWHFFIFEAALH